jgi:peptidoglycan/LPS O-acetylase OafA/YrhL
MEPPYLAALVIFFIALVFVVNKFSFSELLPHFFASVFYVHNAVYLQNSYILPVAWTLEIEVQFYLVAPLLGFIYKIKKREIRWLIFFILVISSTVYWFDVWHGMHLLKYLHYFLCGMLIADLYVEKIKLPKNENLGLFIGTLSCIALPFVLGYYDPVGYFVKYLLMVVLFYTVLTNQKLAKIFSFTPVAIIGGMCYSIYLIHEQVISAAGRLIGFIDTGNASINFVLFFLFLSGAVLFASAVFYKLIEQPCMRKNWWKNLLSKKRNGDN